MRAFPQLNQDILNNVHKLEELEEEFFAYQAMSGNEIPQHVWELAKVNENADEAKVYYRMDIIYGQTFAPIYQLLQMLFFKC